MSITVLFVSIFLKTSMLGFSAFFCRATDLSSTCLIRLVLDENGGQKMNCESLEIISWQLWCNNTVHYPDGLIHHCWGSWSLWMGTSDHEVMQCTSHYVFMQTNELHPCDMTHTIIEPPAACKIPCWQQEFIDSWGMCNTYPKGLWLIRLYHTLPHLQCHKPKWGAVITVMGLKRLDDVCFYIP